MNSWLLYFLSFMAGFSVVRLILQVRKLQDQVRKLKRKVKGGK